MANQNCHNKQFVTISGVTTSGKYCINFPPRCRRKGRPSASSCGRPTTRTGTSRCGSCPTTGGTTRKRTDRSATEIRWWWWDRMKTEVLALSTRVGFSDSGLTLHLVQKGTKPVLHGPNSTGTNLFDHGENTRLVNDYDFDHILGTDFSSENDRLTGYNRILCHQD